MSRANLSFQWNAIASSTVKRDGFLISWATIVLCLCLVSAVILPTLFVVGMAVPNIPVAENARGFDPLESDDDLFVLPVVDLMIVCFISSRFRLLHLASQSALLSPDFPPPK